MANNRRPRPLADFTAFQTKSHGVRQAIYRYSDTQRTARFVFKDGSKKVLPQHLDGSEWITKAGPNEWPAYREEKVTG